MLCCGCWHPQQGKAPAARCMAILRFCQRGNGLLRRDAVARQGTCAGRARRHMRVRPPKKVIRPPYGAGVQRGPARSSRHVTHALKVINCSHVARCWKAQGLALSFAPARYDTAAPAQDITAIWHPIQGAVRRWAALSATASIPAMLSGVYAFTNVPRGIRVRPFSRYPRARVPLGMPLR